MSPPTPVTPTTSRNIAVIGAGAAGLVAARELRREGHKVLVFERNNKIGGTWVYDPNVESDPMSLHPSRTIVHSSLYSSLRTNIPRQAMGFRDYPFVTAKEDGKRDSRRYPGHEEVLQYLTDFACEFQLNELIWFETEVVRVWLVEDGKWGVRYRKGSDGSFADEVFDAVVVCSGHHTEPRVAVIPGLDVWPGKQIHSHNYRVPEPFCDQVVIVIGSSYSGFDISRDIAKVAKEVHVASRSFSNGSPVKVHGHDNIWLHSMVEIAHDDGTVVLQDGRSIVADVILHCTGYRYHFPFLEMADTVTVDDNRVGPLYKHIFPPHLAPGLSFIGIPWMLLPFTVWELQSKWVASVLSGRVSLPSQEVMVSDVEAFYSKLKSTAVPKRYTHKLVNHEVIQFDYYDWLSTECGIPSLEEWRKQMYAAHVQNAVARYETFRDEWDDQNLVLEAEEDFLTYTHSSSDSPITR